MPIVHICSIPQYIAADYRQQLPPLNRPDIQDYMDKYRVQVTEKATKENAKEFYKLVREQIA